MGGGWQRNVRCGALGNRFSLLRVVVVSNEDFGGSWTGIKLHLLPRGMGSGLVVEPKGGKVVSGDS